MLTRKMAISLLLKYPIILVGSSLVKDNPRDIDLVCILPDDKFKLIFKISPKQWHEEGKSGNWSNERYEWGQMCIFGCRILQRRISAIKGVDFKFIPKSTYHGLDIPC